MKYLIITISVFIAMYAITSFGLWDINPEKWGRLNRNGYVGVSLCASAVICLLSKMDFKDD